MLKWLKDAVVQQLVAEVRRNARRYEVIIEMLRSQASVAADLALVKDELSTIHGLIFELKGKVEEGFMGLKDDVETLKGRFDSLESAALATADDIAALKKELTEANERANIDLSPFIARADKMEAGLRAAAGPNAGSDPEPATPPAEG